MGLKTTFEHQELTEPAEYADETVEETTDYGARDGEMAEAIDEDVDDAFDETSDQTDDSAETVAGDGELEAEFEAVETTAENETDNVIAWPLSQADADEIPSDSADLLTEEERAAIEAVTGDESVENRGRRRRGRCDRNTCRQTRPTSLRSRTRTTTPT